MKPNWLVVSALSLLSLLALVSVTEQSVKYFGSNSSNLQASPSSFNLFNKLFNNTSTVSTSTNTLSPVGGGGGLLMTSSSGLSISPTSGPSGTVITITGSGFQPGGNTVYFGNLPFNNLTSDGTHLSITVPPALLVSPTIGVGSSINNIYNISVGTPAPSGTTNYSPAFVLTSASSSTTIGVLSATTGLIGTKVTVLGSGFLPPPNNVIRFGNGYATSTNSTGNTLTFTIPAYLYSLCAFATPACYGPWPAVTPGTYAVSINNSNTINFTVTESTTVTPPATTTGLTISPTSGPSGTVITITGSGFPSGGNEVFFGNIPFMNVPSDGTHLSITVPPSLLVSPTVGVGSSMYNIYNISVGTPAPSGTTNYSPAFVLTSSPEISPLPISNTNPLGLNAITIDNANKYEEQLVWQSIFGFAGYGIYINGEFLATTTNNYFIFPAAAMMPDSTYTFTVTPLVDFNNVPETIAYQPKAWWQSLLAQVIGAGGTTKSNVNVTTRPAPKVVNGNLRVLGIVVGMAGTDGTPNGPGAVSSPETAGDVSSKLFSPTFSTKTVYNNQSNGKAQIGGNVIYITIPYDSDYANPTHILIADAVNTVTTMAYIKAAIQDPIGYSYPAQYNVVIYVWPTINSNTNGVAITGVSDPNTMVSGAKIYINGIQNVSTYNHEIGHVLGLVHGDKLLNLGCIMSAQGCTKADMEEYGDGLSIMGNKAVNKFIDHDKAILKWIPDATPVAKSGPYTINSSSAFNIPKQDSGDKYYIENYCGVQDVCDSNWGLRVRIEVGSKKGALYGREMLLTAIPLSSGSSYEDSGNNFRIIDKKSSGSGNSLTSDVFVRFDATTTLKAKNISAHSIKLDWIYPTKASGVLVKPTGGYEIYRDGTTTDKLIKTITDPTISTYTDNNVEAVCLHKYYIRAFDSFDEIKDTNGNKVKFYIKPYGSAVPFGAVVAIGNREFNTFIDPYVSLKGFVGQSFTINASCPNVIIADVYVGYQSNPDTYWGLVYKDLSDIGVNSPIESAMPESANIYPNYFGPSGFAYDSHFVASPPVIDTIETNRKYYFITGYQPDLMYARYSLNNPYNGGAVLVFNGSWVGRVPQTSESTNLEDLQFEMWVVPISTSTSQ